MSRHASGSSTPVPAPVTDIYRPTTSATQRTIAPLLPPGTSPTTRPSIPEILGVDDKIFTARVANKNILIDTGDPSNIGSGGDGKAVSELVVGRKRHRGYPQELLKARREAEYKQEQRDAMGADGLRKVRRKMREGGGVVGKGVVEGITYQSLVPLHHLHLAYLTALLALPPLPPPSSTHSSPPITSSSSNVSSLPDGLGVESIQSRILKSDLTGSILLVLASRNPSLTGIRGIVVEETASTIRLISRDDFIRIVPKNGTQFQLSFPAYAPPPMTAEQRREVEQGEPEPAVDWETHERTCPRVRLDILGTAFGYRSADRAGRKFRPAQGGGGGSGWGEKWVRGEWSTVLEGLEQELEARKGSTRTSAPYKQLERGSRKGQGRKAGSGAGASESGHDANGGKKRKRGKSRRKDLPAWGRLDVP